MRGWHRHHQDLDAVPDAVAAYLPPGPALVVRGEQHQRLFLVRLPGSTSFANIEPWAISRAGSALSAPSMEFGSETSVGFVDGHLVKDLP